MSNIRLTESEIRNVVREQIIKEFRTEGSTLANVYGGRGAGRGVGTQFKELHQNAVNMISLLDELLEKTGEDEMVEKIKTTMEQRILPSIETLHTAYKF